MLVLGHAGITLGAALLLAGTLSTTRLHKTGESQSSSRADACPEQAGEQDQSHSSKRSWLSSLASHVDIRVLLIGSLLPDIVDKPVGQYFLADTFSNGKIFCHSLLFIILISLAGFLLLRTRSSVWLLVLAFGSFVHLILDQMWLAPRTLLWPAYGFAFESVDLTNWTTNMLRALLTEPSVGIPELTGAVILIWFVVVLARRREIYSFIKTGQVS